jgi:hypothetical protein
MKFSEYLLLAIQRSEIPLRFEPGAGEAVARPVIEFLIAWLLAHEPESVITDFERGRMIVIQELLEELAGDRVLPEN